MAVTSPPHASSIIRESTPRQLPLPLNRMAQIFFFTPKFVRNRFNWSGLWRGPYDPSSTAIKAPLILEEAVRSISPAKDVLNPNYNFEVAYQGLSDRRGVNATPAGRIESRRVWLDAGADAARWLIDRLRTEEHPETIIGIAETITEMRDAALPIVLEELEGDEAKPEHATLIEALSWMNPPTQPLLMSRIECIIDRYLASPHIDCQVAAVQLTRILDDNAARTRLNAALRNAGQRLHEEINDLLDERFPVAKVNQEEKRLSGLRDKELTGAAYKFTTKEVRHAGMKGAWVTSRGLTHISRIGRMGAIVSWLNRRRKNKARS